MGAVNPKTGKPYSRGTPGTPGSASPPSSSGGSSSSSGGNSYSPPSTPGKELVYKDGKLFVRDTTTGKLQAVNVSGESGKVDYTKLEGVTPGSSLARQIEESQKPLTPQQIQENLLRKQGASEVTATDDKLTAVTKEGKQVVITKYGDVVSAPRSATVGNSEAVRAAILQKGKPSQAEKETILLKEEAQKKYSKKERPAEKAAILNRLSFSYENKTPEQKAKEYYLGDKRVYDSPYGTKFQQLLATRTKELQKESGVEKYTAHYPVVSMISKNKTVRLGTQISSQKTGKIPSGEFTKRSAEEIKATYGQPTPGGMITTYVPKTITEKVRLTSQKAKTFILETAPKKAIKTAVGIYTKVDTKAKQVASYIPESWETNLFKLGERARKDEPLKFARFLPEQILKPATTAFPNGFAKDTSTAITTVSKSIVPGTIEFTGGYVKGLRTKPTQTVLTTAAFFALPPILKGAGKFVTPVTGQFASLFPKTSSFIGSTINYSIPVVYGGSIAARAGVSAKPYAALGEIASTEVTPMIVGGAAGAYVWPRFTSYFKRFGRDKIEIESLVPEEVLSGKQNFPLGPKSAQKQLKMFKRNINRLPEQESPVMFHAAPEKITDLTIGKGSSELPGLYGSTDISAYFFKLGGTESKLYGGSIFSPYGNPQALAIYPKGFRARSFIRTAEGYKFLGKDMQGVADVPGMKTEIEAILPPDTQLQSIKKKFFTVYKGMTIPIDEFTVAATAGQTGATTTIGVISSSYGPGYSYKITPGSLVGRLSKLSSASYSTKSSIPKSMTSLPTSVSTSYNNYSSSATKLYSTPSYLKSSGSSISSSAKPSYSSSGSSSSSSSSGSRSSSSSSSSSASSLSSSLSSLSSSSYSSPSKSSYSKSSASKSSSSKSSSSYSFSRSSSSYGYSKSSTTTTPIPSYKSKGQGLFKSFDVFIKRKGSFQVLGRGLTKGRALKLGSQEALKTLGATFKIEARGTTVKKDIPFAPAKKYFREYKIVKGKRVETPGTFIQKRGTRLTTRSERQEITSLRKLKLGRMSNYAI